MLLKAEPKYKVPAEIFGVVLRTQPQKEGLALRGTTTRLPLIVGNPKETQGALSNVLAAQRTAVDSFLRLSKSPEKGKLKCG
jgi:hypothetical protein